MKKNILIISLITVFILGSFGFAFASLLPQRDNVQFSETVLFGDPKAAEGLTLNFCSTYDRHLFWDTAWTIGTPADTAETDYYYTASPQTIFQQMPPAITLESHGFAAYEVNGEPSGLQKAFDELAEKAIPDKSNSRIVGLSEYYPYYPVAGTLNLPGLDEFRWDDSRYTLLKRTKMDEESRKIIDNMKAFQEFFKIPVLPHDTIEISVYVNSEGDITSTRSSYGSDTIYSMKTESAVTGEACYFTFTTRSWNDQYIDTSLIPGGFGIYRLPYSAEGIQPENLSMVYPLDPKTQVVSMQLNSGQTSLFLFTEEADELYFTEISLSTMETLQRLKINDSNVMYDYLIHVADDYFAFYGTDSEDVSGYRIFSRDESGQFKFDFLIPPPQGEEHDYFNFYSYATFAYDGERAALTGLAVSTSHWSSAFTVAVYDETGMLYCGEYNTGQNCREYSQGNYNCSPVANELAAISWS